MLLRSEVGVEAPVRQPGALHQLVEADAVESLFSKESARRLEDPSAILFCLLSGDLHGVGRIAGIVIFYPLYDGSHYTNACDDYSIAPRRSHRRRLANNSGHSHEKA